MAERKDLSKKLVEELKKGFPVPTKSDPRMPDVIRKEVESHSTIIPADEDGMPMLDIKGSRSKAGKMARKMAAKMIELFALGPKGVKSEDESIEEDKTEKGEE